MRRLVLMLCWRCGIAPAGAQRGAISAKPDTPFKLATFEAAGRTRIGLVIGARVIDIPGANAALVRDERLDAVPMPTEMRALIEEYSRVSPRLYQIANYFTRRQDSTPRRMSFELDKVAIKAPIKYPYNLLAAAANYKLHAGEMFPPGSPQQKAANEADQDKEDPVFFAKSPRSCIIDPGEPYFIPPGRNIDWEGELAIVIGKPALRRHRSGRARLRVRLQHHVRPQRSRRHRPQAADRDVRRARTGLPARAAIDRRRSVRSSCRRSS